jgi:hypothetical protein
LRRTAAPAGLVPAAPRRSGGGAGGGGGDTVPEWLAPVDADVRTFISTKGWKPESPAALISSLGKRLYRRGEAGRRR